ncbi:MAG TPA: dihydrolipoamide acetyltransferase family protein [Vicinamibacterales bacterium]|nr:dihydrolipoamide acetyltransferase family protein [Vicinamibacterales bacterium]
MIEFRMPALGAEMEAGTLVQWLKQPGDALKRGDIIAVVDTEKGAIEIEVFDDGVLDRILVEPGGKVPVGTPLALIRSAGEGPSTTPPQAAAAAPPTGAAGARKDVRASPGARQAAEQLKVDLARVVGTGPAGAITRDDVERAAGSARAPEPTVAPSTPAATAADKMAAMRSAIGAAMSRSKREIPHLYLSTTIDMTAALAWLAGENAKRAVERRLLPVVLLIKAVAAAIVETPGVNGYWVDERFRAGAGVHVGCAIALAGGGLVAPAIHDADRKDLDAVMSDLTDLVARARRGTLRSSELADPTITVTNLGDLGVEATYAVIYPPQVAIVGFGKAMPRPWVIDGRIEVRTVLTATVSADHRAVDGRRAAQFLAAVDKRLQKAEQL